MFRFETQDFEFLVEGVDPNSGTESKDKESALCLKKERREMPHSLFQLCIAVIAPLKSIVLLAAHTRSFPHSHNELKWAYMSLYGKRSNGPIQHISHPWCDAALKGEPK